MKNKAMQALSLGLLDGGCKFATNFPGFYSHDIFRLLGGHRISLNEKIAYQEAYGSSLSGQRSCVSFKNVGLNVASDAYLNSLLSGVNAGLVVIVTDDMEVQGSQSRQDSRHYHDFFGGLWLEPNTIQSAYALARESFILSERFNVPIVIRLTNQFFELSGNYKRRSRRSKQFTLPKNKENFIVHPHNWKKQWANLQLKNNQIETYTENYALKHQQKNTYRAIACGNCANEIKISKIPISECLLCETYPLPLRLIKKSLSGKSQIPIFEQGDAYASKIISASITNSRSKVKSNTGQIPNCSKQYRVWTKLEKLFKALKNIRASFVVSDLTQFTIESTHTINSCLCLGSAISVTMGLANKINHPFCVTGDVSFLHEGGIYAIKEAQEKNLLFSIVVIDNGGSWCTGNQKPAIPLDFTCLKNVLFFELNYNKASYQKIKTILNNMKKSNKISLLRVKYHDNK